MAITKYPLIDAFETTLSQEWDGLTGTIYVNSVPEFTFPGGVTTYIVIDADNSKIQVAEINAISTGAKTMTVNSVSVAKGNSVAYTSQVHSIGAKVRISDNYIFWKTIVDAVNGIETGTVQTNVNGTTIGTYADATARDAAITSPVNGKYQAYLTTEGYWTDYVGGAWLQRATGVTPNASTTVSGKVELSTDAQFTAGTATGETGAPLVATPDQLKKSISLKNSTSSFNDADEFGINQGGEDKRITKTTMRDQLAASTTAKGTVEMAEDSEAIAGTDESRYVNSKQLHDNISDAFGARSTVLEGTTYQAASNGLLVGRLLATGGGSVGLVTISSDSSATPTTTVFVSVSISSSSRGTWSGIPIKKNDYYKVVAGTPANISSFSCFFHPMN